jgi:hypothetical protein
MDTGEASILYFPPMLQKTATSLFHQGIFEPTAGSITSDTMPSR